MSAPGKARQSKVTGETRRPGVAVVTDKDAISSCTGKTSPSTENNSIGEAQPHCKWDSRFKKDLRAASEIDTPTRARCCSDTPLNGQLRNDVGSTSGHRAKGVMNGINVSIRSQHKAQIDGENKTPRVDPSVFDTDSLG